jgi:hypothetical protein
MANGLKEKDAAKLGGLRNSLVTQDEEAAFMEKWINPGS